MKGDERERGEGETEERVGTLLVTGCLQLILINQPKIKIGFFCFFVFLFFIVLVACGSGRGLGLVLRSEDLEWWW